MQHFRYSVERQFKNCFMKLVQGHGLTLISLLECLNRYQKVFHYIYQKYRNKQIFMRNKQQWVVHIIQ